MEVELQINNSANPSDRFLGWVPSPCQIRVTNPSGTTTPTVNLTLSSASSAGGGAVSFRAGTSGAFAGSLSIDLPTAGASVPFFCAGVFGSPSTQLGDVTILVNAAGTLVTSIPVTVRIRKNANTLTASERTRFVAAFAQLNNQGLGRFADFRDMHTSIALPEAHGAPGFLPWHRAYILDLERELQAIDPSVAVPYWKFDEPAPNLFTSDFLGTSDSSGNVDFGSTNPLQFWRTDGDLGVLRQPLFDTQNDPANVISETSTLALGSNFKKFRTMEGNPHGSAHVSFDGWISDPSTAPKDPLFFLLHCNVDRLWAKWQKNKGLFDPANPNSFDSNVTNRIGHNLGDTMWPWNGVTVPPRPSTAPGGTLATSTIVSAPGPSPRVEDLLDYQGVVNSVDRLGSDYDDVPF